MYNWIQTNQDSFPTWRMDLGNLSLVFKSVKHPTAINNTTNKNRDTSNPDKAEGVITLSMGLIWVWLFCNSLWVSEWPMEYFRGSGGSLGSRERFVRKYQRSECSIRSLLSLFCSWPKSDCRGCRCWIRWREGELTWGLRAIARWWHWSVWGCMLCWIGGWIWVCCEGRECQQLRWYRRRDRAEWDMVYDVLLLDCCYEIIKGHKRGDSE